MRERRSQILAIIMLAVFLPAWLQATLHKHAPVDLHETECAECVHHLPHQGHLAPGGGEMSACLLCQLLILPIVLAPAMSVPCFRQVKTTLRTILRSRLLSLHTHRTQSRAPPVLSFA